VGCAPAATPVNPRLSVHARRVGFGADPARQLRFAGQLNRKPDAGAKVFLDHGPTPRLGGGQPAEVRSLLSQVPQADGGVLAAEQYYVHASIDGLPAATAHYYRWRTSDGFTGDTVAVRTGLAAGRANAAPFSFTMMGDQGTDAPPSGPPGLKPGAYQNKYEPNNNQGVRHVDAIVARIAAAAPAFHLLGGDLAYADLSSGGGPPRFAPDGRRAAGFDSYNPYVWDTYFQSIEPTAAHTPWMFTTGNHEMEALYDTHGYGGLLARLDFPGNGAPECPSSYTFGYGNVAIVSLDANEVCHEFRANAGYSGGRQTAWLGTTLAAHRANPDIDFIVCFFHECAYSTGGSDTGVRSWAPLFDQYQVDVVLQGHNHLYERTDPIRAGVAAKPAPDNSVVYPATDGTVYYTVGGGGRPRGTFAKGEHQSFRGHEKPSDPVESVLWQPDGAAGAELAPWSRVRYRNYSFIRADVRPGSLSAELDIVAVNEHGDEFDRLTFRRAVG
jgi:hypothetical protein